MIKQYVSTNPFIAKRVFNVGETIEAKEAVDNSFVRIGDVGATDEIIIPRDYVVYRSGEETLADKLSHERVYALNVREQQVSEKRVDKKQIYLAAAVLIVAIAIINNKSIKTFFK